MSVVVDAPILEGVHVCNLTLDDLEEMTHIHKLCFSKPWSAKSFRELLQLNTIHGFGVYQSGAENSVRNLIGFALISFVDQEGELLTICVTPSLRRHGVGAYLLAEIMQLMVYCNYRVCFLDVDEKNTSAIKLYEKFGFQVYGERKDYYIDMNNQKSKAYLMQKFIM